MDGTLRSSRTFATILLFASMPFAHSEPLYLVTDANRLAVFDTTDPPPLTFNTIGTISGLQPGETIVGIDFRPGPGDWRLYGVGDSDRVYEIDIATAAATAVNAIPFSTPISGTLFGMDIDPVLDQIRLISDDGQNLRIDLDAGMIAAVGANLPPGSGISAIAYDANNVESAATTLFGVNPDGTFPGADDDLFRIGGVQGVPSPDGGSVTLIGDICCDFTHVALDVTQAGTTYLVANNVGILAGFFNLYSIDLQTGAGTFLGQGVISGETVTGLSAPGQTAAVTPSAIPTLAPMGILLLVLALLSGSAYRLPGRPRGSQRSS